MKKHDISHWKYFALITSISFIAFMPVITAEFKTIDDPLNIYKNKMFMNIGIKELMNIWTSSYEHLYIPVTYTFWAAISLFSKLIHGKILAWPFHFANILTNALNAGLVFCLLKKILNKEESSKNNAAAFIGSLFFGLHPVHTEAVGWATGMKDLLSSFFSIVSLYFYTKTGYEKKVSKSYAVSFFMFLAACFSKPNSITVPFIAILIDTAFGIRPFRKSLLLLSPMIALSIILSVAAKKLMPEAPGFTVSLWLRPFVAIDSVFFYFQKIIWPDVFYHDYGRKIFSMHLYIGESLLPLIYGFLACTACIIKRQYAWIYLFMIFFVCIAPYSGLQPFEFQRISTVADRYAYMALLPFSIGIALILKDTDRRIISLAAVLIAYLFIKSSEQSVVWKDNITLNSHTLKYNEQSFTARLNLGIALIEKGRSREAIEQLKKAQEIAPDAGLVYYNQGIAYAYIGNSEMAAEQVKALRSKGRNKDAELLEIVIVRIARILESGSL